MVRTMAEATNLGGEGQSMSGAREEIFRYSYGRSSIPLYKAFAAEGQAKKTVSHHCRPCPSVLRNRKKYHEARLASFYVCTPSIQCLPAEKIL